MNAMLLQQTIRTGDLGDPQTEIVDRLVDGLLEETIGKLWSNLP